MFLLHAPQGNIAQGPEAWSGLRFFGSTLKEPFQLAIYRLRQSMSCRLVLACNANTAYAAA